MRNAGSRAYLASLVAAALAGIIILVLLAPSGALADGSFVAEGDIQTSNPLGSSGGGVTENDFTSDCMAPPDSQGVDGLVFALPETFLPGGDPISATGASVGPYDLDLSFFTSDCFFISTSSTAPDETTTVPNGSSFVVVNLIVGASVHACVVAGTGECAEPSPTPTATPSPTPISTAIDTTLETSDDKVRYRKDFVLTGMVTADPACEEPFTVSLSKWVPGDIPELLAAEIPVAEDGTWTYSHSSRFSATYEAMASDASTVCEDISPASRDVAVTAKILMRKPTRCSAPQPIKGRVKPSKSGTEVVLKARKGGRFKTISKDRLDKNSRFILESRKCSGRFRISWPSQDETNASASKNFRL